MDTVALIVGLLAVFLYLLGYLQKRKRAIMVLNLSSRCLYVLQYVLLGAFSGAALDVAGAVTTVVAGKKDVGWIKRHKILTVCVLNAMIIALGVCVMILTQDPLGVLSILGVGFHVNAFWFDKERTVRRLSILGCPFWLAYNFLSGAYGSCIGDVLSMVSLGIAMWKYDRKNI